MSARISAEEFYNDCIDSPLDMVMLRRIFLLLTRVHWGDAENHYQQPNPFDCLVYSDEEKDSRLTVDLTDIYNEDETDNFPGVFVGFEGGFTLSKITQNYEAVASDDGSAEHRIVSWKGRLVIKHVHQSADIAMAMADSTFAYMMALRSSLMSRFPIRQLDIVGVTDPQNIKPQNARRFFKVDLVSDVEFTATVSINMESHRIKKWGLKMSNVE